jgi:hypothetical protein
VPNWERLPRNVTVNVQHSGGVYFPGEAPHHGLAMVERSGPAFSLSLCLVKEGFSLGKLRKIPSPLQLCGRQSEETQMPGGDLYCTANATWVEPDFSVPSLFLFSSP